MATQAAGLVIVLGALGIAIQPPPPLPVEASKGLAAVVEHVRPLAIADEEEADGSGDLGALDRGLVMPTGDPTRVSCEDARTVVQQVRTSLAAPAAPVDAAKFAVAAGDWLDPHGLWSVAPDAPAGAVLRHRAERLLAEMEAPPGSGPCGAAQAIGGELAAWSKELRAAFDQGAREARARPEGADLREAWRVATSTPFQDGDVTRDARDLARELGRDAAVLQAAYGDPMAPYAAAVRKRTAPELDVGAWARAVTAAALRAYVPQLDAHGAWAPLDEELSIYDLSLEADPPAKLWTDRVRTPVGVRIQSGAMPPLMVGDVVLEVGHVPLAGMSVEQVEQLAVLSDTSAGVPTRVIALRQGEPGPIELAVSKPKAEGEGVAAPASELSVTLLGYGEGRIALIPVDDVPDDLGPRLGAAMDRAKEAHDLRGVVLDLRANGGGSTDGAMAAIGLFLPGATLFPMRRRDGGLEVERAPDVPSDRRYGGPLAVLVDGDSASAAEMIAGGLLAYHRAVLVGDRTYGKGCAQEYLDDDAHTGVLRLTTLLFALPDGSPLQKTGIVPNVRLSLPVTTEREASMVRALGPWRGPDVRDAGRVRDVPWPSHSGRVGPCRDATVCRALRALGATRAAAR